MGAAQTSRRILLVEDNHLLVRAWRRALHHAGWDVTSATTLKRARSILDESPDLQFIVLDLILPDGNGASLAPVIDRLPTKPLVIVASGHLDSEIIAQLGTTCRLAVPKPIAPSVLSHLIKLLDDECHRDTGVQSFCEHSGLSPRETELVHHGTTGCLCSKEVAERIGIKPGTVRNTWSRICEKTGCKTREQVIIAAFEHRSLH